VRSLGYYKEELPNEKACRSLTVFMILKFKTIGWALHAVLMRETRNACIICYGNFLESGDLGK
jgi:hypothetical protein